MASSTISLEPDTLLEDVLAQLPISGTTDYARNQIIYSAVDLSKKLYLVVTGTVGISQIAEDGREVLLEVVRPDELFGESAFLDARPSSEQATAIERATLMTWDVSEMEDLVMKRPRLAVALLQIIALRSAEFIRRIESHAIDTIERRLARSLIRFSERLGTPQGDGSVRMMPFSHTLLSRYVGSSRESINHCMNRFRKQGYVNYSRQHIYLYRDALAMVVHSQAGSVSCDDGRCGFGIQPAAIRNLSPGTQRSAVAGSRCG